jgi:nucleoid-associated protein YgaU
MGLLSLIKEAGEKLFGFGKAKAAQPEAPVLAAQAVVACIQGQGINTAGLNVAFDPATATVTVDGTVADLIVVSTPAPAAQYHMVVSGDKLSKIARKFYRDANKYPLIFEADEPMLQHPDKIYPGQMLRIPPV